MEEMEDFLKSTVEEVEDTEELEEDESFYRRSEQEPRRIVREVMPPSPPRTAEQAPAMPPPLPVQAQQQTQRGRQPYEQPKQRSARSSMEDAYSEGQVGAYEQVMKEKLAQIEQARLQAEQLGQQVSRKGVKPAAGTSTPRRKRTSLASSVKTSLNSPQSAKMAFVYGEILGKPVGLKE